MSATRPPDARTPVGCHSHLKVTGNKIVEASGSPTPNILFELWNEPAGNNAPIPTWLAIKTYAEAVIPVIRAHSPNQIIVGTPFWSVMDKAEASSILPPDESDEAMDGRPDKGHWAGSRLTPSGK